MVQSNCPETPLDIPRSSVTRALPAMEEARLLLSKDRKGGHNTRRDLAFDIFSPLCYAFT